MLHWQVSILASTIHMMRLRGCTSLLRARPYAIFSCAWSGSTGLVSFQLQFRLDLAFTSESFCDLSNPARLNIILAMPGIRHYIYLSGLKVPSVSLTRYFVSVVRCDPKLPMGTYRCTRLCLQHLPYPAFVSWHFNCSTRDLHSRKLKSVSE